MIRRVRLVNFMSHVDTTIEPADGLTVLVGPNNCGKSAVVAALQAICENTRGEFMMRHGGRETRVIVETDDGHIVEWIRKRGTASYILDGTRIDRGQAPENLHDLLRLASVSAPDSRDSFDVHFGVQKSPIFLLDQPPSRAAMFFASSSDASKLMEMQRLHRAKVLERRRDEQRLVAQVDRLREHLTILESVTSIQEGVQAAEKLHTQVKEAISQTTTLQRVVATLETQERVVALAREQSNALAPLAGPPPVADTQHAVGLLEELERLDRLGQRESARCTRLAMLSDPPSLADVQPLETLCQQFDIQGREVEVETAKGLTLEPLTMPPDLVPIEPLEAACKNLAAQDQLVGDLQGRSDALAQLPDPPDQHDIAVANMLVAEVEQAVRATQAASAKIAALEKLAAVPAVQDLDPMTAFLGVLETAEDQAFRHGQTVAQAQADLAVITEAIQTWAESNPTCPTCGAAIDPERLLVTGGHNHG